MVGTPNLTKVTTAQKLRKMEALWDELTHGNSKFASPSWHFDELLRTETDIKSGKVQFADWQKAKASIRRRTK